MLSARLRYFPAFFIYQMTRDPLGYLTQLHQRHGDFVEINTGLRKLYAVLDPDLIRDVLVSQAAAFRKSPGLQTASAVLGQGLLTADGDLHLRQRRLVQPAFHKQRLQAYADVMVRATLQRLESWREGQCLDLSREMMAVTLDIITQTMFSEMIGGDVEVVARALDETLLRFQVGLLPLMPLIEKLPLPANRRFQEACNRLDHVLLRLIRARRGVGGDRGDLLSMLLQATDDEDGQGMSDQQLRDEAMTIFLAGHETTANTLAWMFALLAAHPAARHKVQLELDVVLEGRTPTLEDVGSLVYCRQVLQETMRLYPPAWILGRQAVHPVQLGGQALAQGAVVLMSQWVAHRQERWFAEPHKFLPERWNAEAESLPKFAYFPFGGGNRICIGEGFARTEAILVLATVLQRWEYTALARDLPSPLPRITLRPTGGVPAILRRRAPFLSPVI
jgi:cytochrome P450